MTILRVVDEPQATAAIAAPSAALTDAEVVARVCAGETGLFEVIMRRYNQRLFRVVRSVVRADVEAEDVVQQAYVSAYTHLSQFAGHAQFATWLTRIAINEGLARLRQRARETGQSLDEEDESMPQTLTPRSPEDEASRREMSHILEKAIDELPTIYRVVFVMRELEQMSTAESASALDITEETIKVRLHRAKGLLRTAISSRMQESMPEAFPVPGSALRQDRPSGAVAALFGASARSRGLSSTYRRGVRAYRMPSDEGARALAIGRPLHRMRLQRVGNERCDNHRRRGNRRRRRCNEWRKRCSSLLTRSESQARGYRRRHRARSREIHLLIARRGGSHLVPRR